MWPPHLPRRRRLLGRPARWSAVAAVVALVVSSGLALPTASRGASRTAGFVRAATVDGRTGPVVGIARTVGTDGYWVVTANGRVSTVGGAAGLPSVRPNRWTGPVTAVAATPGGTGMVVVTAHGRVYTIGAGPDYPALHPTWHEGLVAAVAVAPGGRGVWVVTTHGQVFTLGAAPRLVSVHATWRTGSVTAAVATAGGRGLRLVTARGAILTTGRAPRLPSVQVTAASGPVTAAVASPGGRGLWLVTAHGHILTAGAAPRYPAVGVDRSTGPVTAATDPPGGLWLATAAGMVVARPADATTPPSSTIATTDPPTTDPSPATTVPVATTTANPSPTTTGTTTAGPTVEVPASIPDNCTADTTAALNTLFAGLPTDATVVFPDHGCYLVSGSNADRLLIATTQGLTVEGNGTTLRQATYETASGANACNGDIRDPVLTLNSNTDLAINNLILDGPNKNGSIYNCDGPYSEGDAGILVGGPADPVGNHGVTFTGVTVENVNGDGIELYPQLYDNKGANSNVTFQDGTLTNWGWFGVVGEGVDGFTFAHNSVNGGGFMDVEVDNSCFNNCLHANGTLRGDGVDNMNIADNTFQVGDFLVSEGPQGCIPENDWTITGNNFGTGSAGVALDGSHGNPACPDDNTGFTYTHNSGGITGSSCGGSMATPPANCAGLGLSHWADVSIEDNNIGFGSGVLGWKRTITDATITTTGGVTTVSSPNFALTPADTTGEGAHGGDFVLGNGIPYGDQIATVLGPTAATLTTPAADASYTTISIGVNAYYPNGLVMQAVGLCSVAGANVTNNTFNSAYSVWNDTRCFDASPPYAATDVTACGNTYGLTDPQPFYVGAALTAEPAPAPAPLTDSHC